MSYCRFSCDNFQCDVYCYEDISGGFTTHVAGNRCVGEIPKVPSLSTVKKGDEQSMQNYIDAHNAQMQFLENCERVEIESEHAGKSYNDDDLSGLLARLTMLKECGFNVPDFVFESIKEELADDDKQAN
jgi:hypothetical protein